MLVLVLAPGVDGDWHHLQRAHGQHPAQGSDAADVDLSDPGAGAIGRDAVDHGAGGGQADRPDTVAWLKMLIGFDVVYTAVSLVLVETVLVG